MLYDLSHVHSCIVASHCPDWMKLRLRTKTSNDFKSLGTQLESLRQHDCQYQAEKVLYSRSQADGLRSRIRLKQFGVKVGTHATTSAIPFPRRSAGGEGEAENFDEEDDGVLGDDIVFDDEM